MFDLPVFLSRPSTIEDLRSISNGTSLDADLCIIGSGPAGWVLAEELKDAGLRILMVESGGIANNPLSDSLNEVEDIGTPLFNGRGRVLGGTSHLWNGRCIPFDDIDYAERPWIPRSGWPFSAEALGPYVDRAAAYLSVGPYYESGARRPIPPGVYSGPEVDHALLRPIWWENPAPINFGRLLVQRRHGALRILVHATVTQINTDVLGRYVQSVEVADDNGRRLTIQTRTAVLCAGGIENPRILLNSNRVGPQGLGNTSGNVGRYLMDHPRDLSLIASVGVQDTNRFRALFGPHKLGQRHQRRDFSYGFTLSAERQRSEHLVNAAAWPYEVKAEDDPFAAIKRIVKGPYGTIGRDLGIAVSQARPVAHALYAWMMRGQVLRRKAARIGFLIASEQVPNQDSRVELSHRLDRLGLPLAKTDWRVGALEVRSQAILAQTIADEFMRLGLPQIHLAGWVRDRTYEDARFADGCHPSGTTRMAVDPYQGVVDAECRVHGVNGLYVAGSSVFPTVSHANPTLTIVALAIRLAETLASVLKA